MQRERLRAGMLCFKGEPISRNFYGKRQSSCHMVCFNQTTMANTNARSYWIQSINYQPTKNNGGAQAQLYMGNSFG